MKNTKNFYSDVCDTHGVYYLSSEDTSKNTMCVYCQFLDNSRMKRILEDATNALVDINIKNVDSFFYYRQNIIHKKTGLIFQRIGIIEEVLPSYDNHLYDVTLVDKIKCSYEVAKEIIRQHDINNTHIPINKSKLIDLNIRGTYLPDYIWQAKSKTIPILRELLSINQKNKCTICGEDIIKPTLDHMHIKKVKGTGFIRATICNLCNTYLARIENNASRHGISNKKLPDVLRNTAAHLENQTQIIHPTEEEKQKKLGTRQWNKIKKYYFKVYPNRRKLINRPTYITKNVIELVKDINKYLQKNGIPEILIH